MRIQTQRLLLLAGIVWFVAGANIVWIGLGSYLRLEFSLYPLLVFGSVAVFLLFHLVIFNKVVKKNSQRISEIEAEQSAFFKFLDLKGYLVMAFMMALGIGMRQSQIVPEWFISFFYSGLGLALMVSGVVFIMRYLRRNRDEHISTHYKPSA